MNVRNLKNYLEDVQDDAIVVIAIRDQDRDDSPLGWTSAIATIVCQHSVHSHVVAVEIQS